MEGVSLLKRMKRSTISIREYLQSCLDSLHALCVSECPERGLETGWSLLPLELRHGHGHGHGMMLMLVGNTYIHTISWAWTPDNRYAGEMREMTIHSAVGPLPLGHIWIGSERHSQWRVKVKRSRGNKDTPCAKVQVHDPE